MERELTEDQIAQIMRGSPGAESAARRLVAAGCRVIKTHQVMDFSQALDELRDGKTIYRLGRVEMYRKTERGTGIERVLPDEPSIPIAIAGSDILSDDWVAV